MTITVNNAYSLLLSFGEGLHLVKGQKYTLTSSVIKNKLVNDVLAEVTEVTQLSFTCFVDTTILISNLEDAVPSNTYLDYGASLARVGKYLNKHKQLYVVYSDTHDGFDLNDVSNWGVGAILDYITQFDRADIYPYPSYFMDAGKKFGYPMLSNIDKARVKSLFEHVTDLVNKYPDDEALAYGQLAPGLAGIYSTPQPD